MSEEKIINQPEKEERIKPKRKYFASNLFVKLFSAIGSMITLACVFAGIIAIFLIEEKGMYYNTIEETVNINFASIAERNAMMVLSCLDNDQKEQADAFLNDRNIAAFFVNSSDSKRNYTYYRENYNKSNLPNEYVFNGKEGNTKWEIYIIPELNHENDAYKNELREINLAYKFRYWAIAGTVICGLLFLILITVYLCGIGYSSRTGELEDNYLTKIPFDVFTVILLFIAFFSFGIGCSVGDYDGVIAIILCGAALVTGMVWLANLIHRIKLGKLFENTLIVKLTILIFKLLKHITLFWKTLIIMTVVSFIEYAVIFMFGVATREAAFVFLFFLVFVEKVFIYPIILYIIVMTRLLFKGGNELSKGNTDYKINTSMFLGEFKQHGENLNNLSGAVNRAVEERIKSERMKTELITNVSHDLKTPLTSVINYSDLINTEAASMNARGEEAEHVENITQYSEVLNRQSNKLKRLLDDLVEISKASTGNMELIMENLDVTTILSQAIGEYEERFEEKNLEVILKAPENSLYIKADSRKLWRVFDNLLQNIYKYSYPGTRVFLEALEKDKKVYLVFKNTSSEHITLTPEELTERFTRNDESRHLEGNGLGLAIAKTMTEAMGGVFVLEIDGDLFKVSVLFDKEEHIQANA
ncbi:MAG: HAMP domain-containing histidine kinase [Lachnospiraceae bacterium]|nr:HAMP domain-containing histidine kinase [Lachnospiraceae bacterium]